MWGSVCSTEFKYQEFIKARRSPLLQSGNRGGSLLDRMLVLSSVCGESPRPFIGRVKRRKVHSHHAYADRVATAFLELLGLPDQIPDHSINLLDHRLREYLRFNTDLDCGNRSSRNRQPLLNDGGR